MSLDQKRLQSLLAVAKAGSFAGAASALGVSQPAVSTSISLLEAATGGPVLIRDRNGATLTPLGEILVQHARAMELLLHRAATEAKLFLGDIHGPLAIGASPVAAADIVPQAILTMKQETPHLAVSIIEGVDDDLIARLACGEIDVLISPLSSGRLPPDIEERALTRGPLTVVMRPSHPLAGNSHLSFKQLMTAEWILPIQGNALRRRIEARFLIAGVPVPEHTISTNSIAGVKALVRVSDCIAIMTHAMAESEISSGLLVCLPIADEHFQQTLGIKRWIHRAITPVSERFVEIIQRNAA